MIVKELARLAKDGLIEGSIDEPLELTGTLPKSLGVEMAARAAGLESLYVIYRELSRDAHAGTGALSRHLGETAEANLTWGPPTSFDEASETVKHVLSFLLIACVVASDNMFAGSYGDELGAIFNDFCGLRSV